MRYFILALVLLNVLYFFYPAGERSKAGGELVRGERGIPLLRLVDEDPEFAEVGHVVAKAGKGGGMAGAGGGKAEREERDEEVLSKNTDSSKGAKKATGVCYTIGPFRREEKAELATQALLRQGVKVDWRAAKERRTKGYAVFLPSYPSQEAAQQVVDKLAANGVDDYYILTDSKHSNAISLGFFTLKAGSEKRVAELKKMGYSPQVEVRFDEIPVYWLDYMLDSSAKAEGLWKGFALSGNVEVLDRDCK